MRRLLVAAAILLGIVILALSVDREWVLRVYHSVPRRAPGADVTLDGVAWRPAVKWDFRDGDYPGSWSWGDWEVADGLLVGRHSGGGFAVYVCPFEHGRDFLMETRLRFVPDSTGRTAEAHLLTRDSRELKAESGAVLFAGQRRVSARHMVDRVEHVLRVLQAPEPVSVGTWHELRYAVRDGHVSVWLDGQRLYRSEQSYPTAGSYREPHFAVRNGTVQFADLKILLAS